MTRTAVRHQARTVKHAQQARAGRVCSPEFLERYVRPHLREAGDGVDWVTKVIQLDGTGAATVQVELNGSPPVFAKLFPFEDGPAVHAKLVALREAGLGAGSPFQAVEPLAWYEEERLLLCQGAPGSAVSELVGGDRQVLADAAARSGAWFGHLHRSPVRIGRPQSLLVTGELTSLAKRLAKTALVDPAYVDDALGMLAQLDRLTHDTVDGVLAQSHGQYRPVHVFLAPDVVTVIDLDRSAPADPARDVAEFLHRMRLGVAQATGDVGHADGASSAFLAAYREVAGADALPNLQFHWARYLLHGLNRKVKERDVTVASREDPGYRLFRDEFDRVVSGRAVS